MHRYVAVFSVSLIVVVLLQWRGNAYGAEFAANADEPAHYVTGLMVHDYLARGFPSNPLEFAREFYSRYPKVAIGHWPPVFYIVQALWTSLFTASRASLLLFMAAISAALLTLTYWLAARYFGPWLAIGGTIFLTTIPGFQEFSRSIMTDMLVTLLALISIVLLARHIEWNQWATALWFGLIAAGAILTKATGIALAPVPILVVLLLGRYERLRDLRFWAPALLVAAICAPWFLLAPDALHESVARYGGLQVRWNRSGESIRYWIQALGPIGAPLVAVGIARTLQRLSRKRNLDPIWLLMLLFLLATIAFRIGIGAWEVPYLVTTLPMLILFFCSGLAWLLKTAFPGRKAGGIAAGILLSVAIARNVTAVPPKPHWGFDNVALDIVSKPALAKAPLLILSDAQGEGAFIAEVAGGERRPGHKIERGSKILSSSTWMGGHYRLRFATAEELMSFLTAYPGLLVVLDTPEGTYRHVEQVRSAVAAEPDRWELLGTYPRMRSAKYADQPGDIQVLRLRKPAS
jgi:hypothetical protein